VTVLDVAVHERLAGRQLSEAEEAIDVALLDRSMSKAKDAVEQAIRAEVKAAAKAYPVTETITLTVTDDMLDPLDRLRLLGKQEAWLELERLGYDVAGRRYIDPGPDGPEGLYGYLVRWLRALGIRIEDELVSLDIGSVAQAALIRAALQVPGARDIASRMVSTALIGGLAETFDTVADIVDEWEYTSVLDGGTCDVCRPLNGSRYASLPALFDVLPNFGPNPRCLGGGRCRCRAVPVNAN